MRKLTLALVVGFALAIPASASEGSGQFRADGELDLAGVLAARFDGAYVTAHTLGTTLAFDLVAADVLVERTWAEALYVDTGDNPARRLSFMHETASHSERVSLGAVVARLDGTATGDGFPATVVAWSEAAPATLDAAPGLPVEASAHGSAVPWEFPSDAGTQTWQARIPVDGAHFVARPAGEVVVEGDFTIYLYGVEWSADAADGPRAFRTGMREVAPGRVEFEGNVLHVTDGRLVVTGEELAVRAPTFEALVDGPLSLQGADGFFDSDSARYEARDRALVLDGRFTVFAQAVEAGSEPVAFLTLSGDLRRASVGPVARGDGLSAETAGKAAAAVGGTLVLVAGSVLVARRGRERWIAGHVEDAGACVELALAAAAAGRPQEALRWYRRARRLAPGDALLALDVGHACDAVGDAQGARAAYEEALRLDPDLAEAHLRYARVLAGAGLQPAALSHLGRALALEPGLAALVPGDAAFGAWRDHPRFQALLGHYGASP